jgi:glutamate synthase domain-containing protein 2
MRKQFYVISFFILFSQAVIGQFAPWVLWTFALTIPLFFLGIYETLQTSRTLLRNYPIVGRGRYWMEVLRPKIYQYFIESDTDGTPISRIYRSVVYERAKEQMNSTPFGTQLNVYEPGYEWINHSIYPKKASHNAHLDMRVVFGGKDCKQPYSMSVLNISAMSFGALSANAVESLNLGAKTGGFAHNTGEGSISIYHERHGGDLIWQVGTGYFGCRDKDGNFCAESFRARSALSSVKMIEVKLSQGAKPGHGGILPASKNTPEIAAARLVQPYTTVESPPAHSAFNGPLGLLEFIAQLRDLSCGKPIGFKLCMGNLKEFEEICQQMIKSGIRPDFITIDGGEGGTGAAPLEFSNSIGTPLVEGLSSADNLLRRYGLRNEIRLIASGKILTGFDMVKAMALGADTCNSARGMMLALGCIQALTCNSNHCPTGIATQDKQLMKGLAVSDKFKRIANFHKHTVESAAEIISAAGLTCFTDLHREHIWRRISRTEVKNYADLFPIPETGSAIRPSLPKEENAGARSAPN